jgi:hypothetical protein
VHDQLRLAAVKWSDVEIGAAAIVCPREDDLAAVRREGGIAVIRGHSGKHAEHTAVHRRHANGLASVEHEPLAVSGVRRTAERRAGAAAAVRGHAVAPLAEHEPPVVSEPQPRDLDAGPLDIRTGIPSVARLRERERIGPAGEGRVCRGRARETSNEDADRSKNPSHGCSNTPHG